MLTLIDGDLFKVPNLDGIAHGVNAEGKMYSGIAVQFRERFPEMHEEYVKLCQNHYMAGRVFYHWSEDNHIWIFNCFSQELAGPNASLGHLRNSLTYMVYVAERVGLKRVGLPWIGTGVGALDREDVLQVFDEVLAPSTVDFIVVNYAPTPTPAPASLVELDTVEQVLRDHVLEWRINAYSSEFEKSGPLEAIQGWCSCLERIRDYTAHVREEIEKVVNA